MLTSVLVFIIAALAVYIFHLRRQSRKQLESIASQLAQLSCLPDSKPIFHQTGDPALQKLLVQVNRLLQEKQESTIAFSQKELAMKKMLTNISHDLRTPLTVVLGLAETLMQDDGTNREEQARRLKLVHSKSTEIVQRLNRFFELVRLESDDVEMPLEQVEITELCRQNLLSFYQQIEEKELHIELDLPEQPVCAWANREGLDRIFQNLLSNALRYGHAGKVIGASIHLDDDYVAIEVWDRGRGISDADQALVFDRLYREEEPNDAHTGGTGLGLAITKKLTAKMKGSIGISSTPFDKTTITVKLQRCK